MTRTRHSGLGLLTNFVSFTRPTTQNFKKAVTCRRSPTNAPGRLVQVIFLLAVAFFLHALSGTGAGADTHLDLNTLNPDINPESKPTGAMGSRSRAVYTAYAEFRKAQAAAAHLHVDPEGHFTYSFSSADVHSPPNIDGNAYWGRRTSVDSNSNAGEEEEGVPEPTADLLADSATAASSPLLAIYTDEKERKRSKVRMNIADDLEHPSLPIGLESAPEIGPANLANTPSVHLLSSANSPEHVTVPDGHRDISRMGRHRQQRGMRM